MGEISGNNKRPLSETACSESGFVSIYSFSPVPKDAQACPSQILQQLFSHTVHPLVADPEIHLTVAPGGAADAVVFEGLVDLLAFSGGVLYNVP